MILCIDLLVSERELYIYEQDDLVVVPGRRLSCLSSSFESELGLNIVGPGAQVRPGDR